MKVYISKIITILILSLTLSLPLQSKAQEIIEIQPLFEYPVAPESLNSLSDTSNYLVEHFWDAMDFKSKIAVDQNALNDAMRVYSVTMRWADAAKTEAATDKLIEKLSKNPTLLTQFTKAAEEIIYGPRAEFWIDGIYIKFLNAFVKNKKVPEVRKTKYAKQLTSLNNTLVGQKAPSFNFTGKNGKSEKYMPMSTPTIIFFGDPTLPEWRMARLRMETNVPLSQAIEQGKLNILYIVPFQLDNWESELKNYSAKWVVGIAPEIGDIVDMRTNPSIYLIGADGNIIMKNAPLEEIINQALKKTDIN